MFVALYVVRLKSLTDCVTGDKNMKYQINKFFKNVLLRQSQPRWSDPERSRLCKSGGNGCVLAQLSVLNAI